MKLLIDSPDEMRAIFPNVLREASGEPSLYNKLIPHIELAQQWIISEILSEAIFDEINEMDFQQYPRRFVTMAIAYRAMFLAMASLDLVLSPNGFAVVSNQNLAPASRERVAKFARSLSLAGAKAIDSIIGWLRNNEEWLESSQARNLRSTLFCSLDSARRALPEEGYEKDFALWDAYHTFCDNAKRIELDLEIHFISTDQMERIRVQTQRGADFEVERVAQAIRDIIIDKISGKCNAMHSIQNIIEWIRKSPQNFPEWHASECARIFNPPVFRNDKKASGYFF